jgi:hypothetical protein
MKQRNNLNQEIFRRKLMKTKIFKHKLLTAGAITALGLGVSISAQAVPEAYGIARLETRNFNVQFSASGTNNDNFETLAAVSGSLTVDDSCSTELPAPEDVDGGDNAAAFNFPALFPPVTLDTDEPAADPDPSDCGKNIVNNVFNPEGRSGDYSRGDTYVSDTSFAGTGAGDVIGEAFASGIDHIGETFQGDGRFTLSVDFEVTEDTRLDVSYDTLYAFFAELKDAGPGSLANAEFKQVLTVTDLATNTVIINLNLSIDAGVSDANVVGPTVVDSDGNEVPVAFVTADTAELIPGAYKLEFSSSVSARVKLFEPDIVVVQGDHFLCYKSFGHFLREKVGLADQFEEKNFDVLKPKMFCNPAIKPELDPDAELGTDPHYLSYKIKKSHREPRHERKMAEVTNQFGTMIVETFKPDRLMVPSGKSLDLDNAAAIPAPGLYSNHYKCYKVKATGFQAPSDVLVLDQFTDIDGKRLRIVRPTRLCTPVDKTRSNGEFAPAILDPLEMPGDHLMCYSVTVARGERFNPRTEILSSNQFGNEELVLKRELEFCVPSTKILLTPEG